MQTMLRRWFVNWPVALITGTLATIMFTWIVPAGVARVTSNRTLWPRILDEYYPTWSADVAPRLLQALGPSGRQAYRDFYLHLDFWFPMLSLSLCYAVLLSLAFPRGSRFDQLTLLALAMYLADVAENLNHFAMAGSYPFIWGPQLVFGPVLSLIKYGLVTVLPLVIIVGFLTRQRATP